MQYNDMHEYANVKMKIINKRSIWTIISGFPCLLQQGKHLKRARL